MGDLGTERLTPGEHAAALIREAEKLLADPSKAQFHPRLRTSITNMKREMEFWRYLTLLMAEHD